MSESVEVGEGAGDFQRFDCTLTDPAALTEATEAARRAVERGECIVLPTDTVYGIGADAFSSTAVQRLLDAKHRGRDMPPPVLIGDASLIRALATHVPESARELIDKHWPGPLTVICKIQPSLRMDLGETDGTIALRVPDHELAREVLRRTGPMAVSSANLSGKPAALTCEEAIDQLGDSVSVYLDGGALATDDASSPHATGAPSTIVDFSQTDDGEILRHGALSIEVLRETLPNITDLTGPEPRGEPLEEPVEAIEASRDDEALDSWSPEPDPDDPLADTTEDDPNQPDLFEDADAYEGEDGDERKAGNEGVDAPSSTNGSTRVSHGSTALEPRPASGSEDPSTGSGHVG